MIALDTNVLIRYLVQDDAAQGARAVNLIRNTAERGEQMFVGLTVLCEATWVLRTRYSLPKTDVVDVLKKVMRTAQFAIQSPDLASRALARYEKGRADFADYVIAEQAAEAGYDELATFDNKLLSEVGFISP